MVAELGHQNIFLRVFEKSACSRNPFVFLLFIFATGKCIFNFIIDFLSVCLWYLSKQKDISLVSYSAFSTFSVSVILSFCLLTSDFLSLFLNFASLSLQSLTHLSLTTKSSQLANAHPRNRSSASSFIRGTSWGDNMSTVCLSCIFLLIWLVCKV